MRATTHRSGASRRVVACLSTVNYWSPYWREVAEAYLVLGFSHVYFGVPLPPTNEYFRQLKRYLRDYIREGRISLVSVVFTEHSYNTSKSGNQYAWALYGYRTPFYHSCIYHARSMGEHWAAINDFDEIPTFSRARESSRHWSLE